ncbi:hypothetical protein D0T84_12310 [Dysgonomonas sp. 521]|uniref:DUF6146 family protein n=1 Tax=Dysgonomonas sp. 521 TaxID=2302932 RepID=UPI0013D3448F|nr:DUF6146 family protein [Dysgonomonas sp. 521]NDV95691.1 hypothetical protein [Dysgonomonas sp. 521]
MRKMIIVLLFVIPCLCFGQGEVSDADIRIENRMKVLAVYPISYNSVKLHIPGEPVKWNGSFVDMPTITNSPPLYIVDGLIMHPDSLRNLNAESIESISIMKENPPSIFSNRFEGVVLITTKGNTSVDPELYEVEVFEPGYETFILTQKPKEYYSISSLKTKNQFMVNEWNYRHNQPLHYNPDIYEVNIDYDSKIHYGLEFEYRLYMFFKFMEKEHRIFLLNNRIFANL